MDDMDQHSESGTGHDRWLDGGDTPERPTSVREALLAISAVTERLLAAGDARAAFPDIYGIITRRVAESVALGEDGLFCEPRWISRLAGRFAERYLSTLRWSMNDRPQDAGAWEVTYDTCHRQGTLPLQHVLLGISAHINFDLAIGIHRTIVELGATDAATLRRYKHDHDAVNHLLRASFPEAFDHLIERHRCEGARLVFHRAYGLAEWATMRVLARWRERVWDDAMEMLHAPSAVAREATVQRMERLSRRYARVLSVPLTFHAVPVPAARPRSGWRVPSVPAVRWQALL